MMNIRTLFLVFALFSPLLGYSQLSPLTDANFEESSLAVRDAIFQYFDVASSSSAIIEDLPLESSESFMIEAGVSGMESSITFYKSFTTSKGYDGASIWVGTNGTSFLSIATKEVDGMQHSTIYWTFEGEEYHFFTLNDNVGFALKENEKPEGECGTTFEPDAISQVAPDLCRDSDCEAVVRILMIEEEVSCVGIPLLFCNLFRILRRLQLVVVLPINQQVLNNSLVDNLTLEYAFDYLNLPNSNQPVGDYYSTIVSDPSVELARQIAAADLVQVVISSSPPAWGRIRGRATIGYADNPNLPGIHSVVQQSFMGAIRYTSIHEIVHNFGGLHNTLGNSGLVSGVLIEGDPNVSDFECRNAHRFSTSSASSLASVLALAPNNNRVPHLSNPDVDWSNVPTGTADDNNALVVRTMACRIANIYNSVPRVSWHNYPSCINPGDENPPLITLNVSGPSGVGPGNGPFTYRWFWSSGTPSQNGLRLLFVPDENGSSLSVPTYVHQTPGITIHVEVTNEIGEVTTLVRYLPIGNCFNDQNEEYSSIRNLIFYDIMGRNLLSLDKPTNEEVISSSQILMNLHSIVFCTYVDAGGVLHRVNLQSLLQKLD